MKPLKNLEKKKLFLFDIDGTLAVGDTLYDGSADLLAYIDRIGGKAYFITFEFKTGDRAEYRVPSDAYLYFAEGDEGTITVRGTEFISFVI